MVADTFSSCELLIKWTNQKSATTKIWNKMCYRLGWGNGFGCKTT